MKATKIMQGEENNKTMINIASMVQEQHASKQNIQKIKRAFGSYEYDSRNERLEGLEDKVEQNIEKIIRGPI